MLHLLQTKQTCESNGRRWKLCIDAKSIDAIVFSSFFIFCYWKAQLVLLYGVDNSFSLCTNLNLSEINRKRLNTRNIFKLKMGTGLNGFFSKQTVVLLN